jgi:hypothetical protein
MNASAHERRSRFDKGMQACKAIFAGLHIKPYPFRRGEKARGYKSRLFAETIKRIFNLRNKLNTNKRFKPLFKNVCTKTPQNEYLA